MRTGEMHLTGAFLDLPGRRVWVERAGAGSTVVFAHAGIADRRMWDGQVAALRDRYHVVRYDQAGYGRSSPALEPYSYVDELDAVLDHAGAETAALVGCSMGGRVILDYTLAHPDRVAALVPVAAVASGEPAGDGLSDRAELTGAIKAKAGERIVKAVIRNWAPLRTDPDVDARIRQVVADNVAGIASMGTMWRNATRAWSRLSEIAVPTLVVVGDRDQPDHVRTAELLASAIDGARFEVLRGVDHNVPVRAEQRFAEMLVGFLDGLDRALWRKER